MNERDVTTATRDSQPEILEPEPAAIAPRTTVVHQPLPDDFGPAPGPRPINAPPSPEGRTQSTERVMLRHSHEVAELFAAMAMAQGEFDDVERTLEATVKSRRTGGEFTYEYETLGDVIKATRAPLAKHGLALMQFPFPGATTMTVRTMVTHKSGQWLYNDIFAHAESLDPQDLGKVITYLCRYTRKAILGIAVGGDDDDTQSVQRGGQQRPQAGQRRSQQQQQQQQQQQSQPQQPQTYERVGPIGELRKKDDGAVVVQLGGDSGFKAATRDAELIKALYTYAAIMNAKVKLTARASSGGDKYLPVLVNIELANGQSAAEQK